MYTRTLKPEIMATMLPKDFPADKLSQPRYKMVVDKDVMVTMRDGVRVAVDVYRPDAPGRFPSLYATSPFQKDLVDLPQWPAFHFRETNDMEWFVSRGYTYVNHDIRGTGKSVEGQYRFFSQEEQDDFYDVIEWTAAQPWCDGNVGMIGESYYAWSQWFAAATQPPHLMCIAPFDGGADMYRDINYHGGILAVGFPAIWYTSEMRGNHFLGPKPPASPDICRWDMPWEVIHHPRLDEFWKTRVSDLTKIQCPVFSIGILHKTGTHLRGNVRGYEEVNVPKKFMLCHGDFEGDEMAIFNSPELRLLLLRWYDHWLKGNDTGFMEEDPVRVFVRGKEVYRPEKEWPLARTDYRKLYLKSGPTGAVESLNDGALAWAEPEAEQSSTTYAYPDPDWSHFSGCGTAVMEDGILHPTKKILTFTSDPLPEDLEVIGSLVLVLYASSDQTETDFHVRLWDQHPDSEQVAGMPPKGRLLTHGRLKATHASTKDASLSKPHRPYYLHEQPQDIEPGKVDRYEIEIWATSCCFKQGHRLRVDLASYDSNALDFGGHFLGLRVGNDTIHHDKSHASHLLVPVIPEG